MVSKKEEIQNKSESLKIMQIGFKQVMDKYKEEVTEFDAMDIKNIGRRALGFYFGEYISDYEFGKRYNQKYNVEQSKTWVSDQGRKGGWEYRNHCVIHREYYNGGFMGTANYSLTGFICYKEDVLEALSSSFLYRLWLYYCKEKKYTKSMDDFSKELYIRNNSEENLKNKIDLFHIVDNFFDDYHRENREDKRDDFFIDIVTEKQLKLKDVIICIYPK